MHRDKNAGGYVVSYAPDQAPAVCRHEPTTREQIAARLAALKGFEFAGEYDPGARYAKPLYFVPSGTLTRSEAVDVLGIAGEHDLFGGVVPRAFVGTKSITHPLCDEAAVAPPGWSSEFARAVEHVVLRGHSAFALKDARRAGWQLLRRGHVRVKPARAIGGRGQSVVEDPEALEAVLRSVDEHELGTYGLVLEEHLSEVRTYSVGQVRVGPLVASYCGVQKLTRTNEGLEVYGGSDLVFARGDFDALLTLELESEYLEAVARASTYDRAAREHYSGFFASRCNYDVIRGFDAQGKCRCGVLEQSWRIGGASGAEVAALELFAADAGRNAAKVCCTERYGGGETPPEHAIVYYHGLDDDVGFITKYTTVEYDAHT